MLSFDQLYAEYKDRFILIASSYLRDKTSAEDLVTDCYMHFWENRKEICASTKNIPAYILGMVRYKCIDALRRKQQHLYISNFIKFIYETFARTSPLWRTVTLLKFSSERMSRRFSDGVSLKCLNCQPKSSWQTDLKIKPIKK